MASTTNSISPMEMTRNNLIKFIADSIPTSTNGNYILISIDGPDASGKTMLANDLAVHLRKISNRAVIRISMDDFHNPSVVRYQLGRTSPEGYYLYAFNYSQFKSHVLVPLAPGGEGAYRPRGLDLRSDTIDPDGDRVQYAPKNAIIVIDGVFLHRPDLRQAWNFSVFLTVPVEVSNARMVTRGDVQGTTGEAKTLLLRYSSAQERYRHECHPDKVCDLLVDNSDFEKPKVLRFTPKSTDS